MSTGSTTKPGTNTTAGGTSAPGSASTHASLPADSLLLERLPRLSEELPKYPAVTSHTFSYGTCGFRAHADLLKTLCHRMGLLAVLLSKKEKKKIVGVMVTASHNLEPDNGLKIIHTNGELLPPAWETYATDLANAATTSKVIEVMENIVKKETIDLEQTGNVFIAKDTRSTSESLSEMVREGVLLMGGNVLDFGLQTTPQLHHLVRMWNFEKYNRGDWTSEIGYYNMTVDAFKQLTQEVDSKRLEMRTPIYVDAAHGVGGLQVSKLAKEIGDSLHFEVRNTPQDGVLNKGCGAEYVQKSRDHPEGFTSEADRGKRCCSLDGDADRIVYHYFDNDGKWHLLDGDKIACLFADFIAEKIKILEWENEVKFGCVQTAYANGASTKYLRAKGIHVAIAKTGVKYCQSKAQEFDIGLFFEANGHGTVIYKDSVVEKLLKIESSTSDEKKKHAALQLNAAYQLLNQATGDALSDLLFVEAILIVRDWSISDWGKIYDDLPSRQTKVKVTDRKLIKCTEDETAVTTPESLVQALQELNASYKQYQGRAFVRPSGTEDVVRVYAEATTEHKANELALETAKAVFKHAKGVGEEPTSFVA